MEKRPSSWDDFEEALGGQEKPAAPPPEPKKSWEDFEEIVSGLPPESIEQLPSASIGERAAVGAKAVGKGLLQAPLYAIQSVGGQIENKGVRVKDTGIVGKTIDWAREKTDDLQLTEAERDVKVLPGLTAGDVQSGVGMAGY